MKSLWDKYKSCNLSPEDFDILAWKIENITDVELEKMLSEEWEEFTSYHETVVPAKESAKARFSKIIVPVIAASLLIVSICLGVSLSEVNNRMSLMADSEVLINSGSDGQMTMSLPDGTSVTLNANSSISYSADFGMKDRKVRMSGEAFFDVAKDEDRKFVVNAQQVDITVYGTRFNVYAYPENTISEVALVEGRVSVTYGDMEVKVLPNEKVCVNKKTGDMVLLKTDNETETMWMKNKLLFVHDSLAHIFDVLQRRFGVVIKCSDDIDLKDQYTGSFRESNINEILDVLQMHYGFKYKHIGNHITITHN